MRHLLHLKMIPRLIAITKLISCLLTIYAPILYDDTNSDDNTRISYISTIQKESSSRSKSILTLSNSLKIIDVEF
jgi:hypothetical protein